MFRINITDQGKSFIKGFLKEYKDFITLSKIKSIAAKYGISIKENISFKKPAINEIFEKLDDEKILSYLRDYYREGLYSTFLNMDASSIQNEFTKKNLSLQKKLITDFLAKINNIEDLKKNRIKLNFNGEFEEYEGVLIKCEEEILQDILAKHNLIDIRNLLCEAEDIIKERKEDASDCAAKSGKVLEGVLKYILFNISKKEKSPDDIPLDKAIQFYLDKLSSKDINFIKRDEPIYNFIKDIKDEFRNISSHYEIEDIESFTFRKVPLSEGTLCLWTTKAIIVFLLKRYEEKFTIKNSLSI